jgi:hypothetical protein
MNRPGLDFIARTLKTAAAVLLIFIPFGIYYFKFWPSLAIFSGGIWSILNLMFIRALVVATIRPGGVDKIRALGLGLVKFPLLYVSGYFLLRVEQFEALHLLIGFSVPLAIIVLKALGRAFMGLDRSPDNGNELKEAV